MITRKYNADNALDTIELIALQSQAKLPMHIHVLPNVFTYLRYSSVPAAFNSLT